MAWFNRDPEYLKLVDDVRSGAQVAPVIRELAKVVESEAVCTARLNRFKTIDQTAKAVTWELGKDPEFPATEASIAPPGASCGDTAHGISGGCSKYDNWLDIKTAAKDMWKEDKWNVFNPVTKQPAAADVAQGSMGTCYFLSALVSIAHSRPEIIKNMFIRPELYDQNIVTTKWLIGGMEATVAVDTTIAFNKKYNQPWFTKPSETKVWWPSLLEKTWSKIFTSYNAAESGMWQMAASAITRAPTVSVKHKPIYDVAAGTQDTEK